MRTHNASYPLSVYYDVELGSAGLKDHMNHMDALAIETAGRKPSGSGTNLVDGVRDLDFRFDTAEELDAAKERLRDAGFRFVP